MKYYLGIDIGTTGTKSMLFDDNGVVVNRGYVPYDLISKKESWFEQNPEDWFVTVVESVKQALDGKDYDVEALSFSAQGGSFFLADIEKDNQVVPLTPALTWMDTRAKEEAEELTRTFKGKFNKITGIKSGAGTEACKIKWLSKNQKDVFSKTKIILTTSDYLYYKLTGKYVIDYTSAGMTGLFDIKNLCWNESILKAVNINKSMLPTLIKAGDYIGDVDKCVLTKMGIDENKKVKVFCGAHDQYAANIGSNYFNENDLLISTGTTWVVFGKTQQLLTNENFLICTHPDNGYGVICSAVSSGSVIEWETKVYSTTYKEIDLETAKREIDEDLFVYPFVSGNGPYRSKKSLNYSTHNLSFRHDKFDIIRASMEGVCFEIKEIISHFKKLGVKYDKIVLAGGATKSPIWMEILATVLGEEIYISNHADRCCFGAYLIAKKGITGNFGSFEFDGYTVKPNEKNTEKYQNKFKKYNKLINYKEK